jgi:hypothetical protein
MRALQLGFSVGASALLTAACGASGQQGPRLSHDAFVTSMRSICRTVNAMHGQFGDPAFDKRLLREGRQELARLRRLNPPKTDEKRLNSAFDHWSSALDDFERLARAQETNDPAGGQKAFRDLAAEVRVIARLIPDYPVGECLGEGLDG